MLDAYYEKDGIQQSWEAFRSRGFSPDCVIGGVARENVSMATVPPFLRTLLVTDGTVTKSLEAYYWEPIVVELVGQQLVLAEASIRWLDVEPGEEVLSRRVTLRGGVSKSIYTRAFSLIRPRLIPAQLRELLLAGSLGIGELIRDCGLETYRELLEIGFADSTAGFGDAEPASGDHIYRTYRIVLGGQPAILLTELFPVSLFDPHRQSPATAGFSDGELLLRDQTRSS